MDKKKLFDLLRNNLFGGAISANQVQHVEAIVDAAQKAGWSIEFAAYALATAHHETARFVHLRELGGTGYFTRMYDIRGDRPALSRQNGNIHPGDGAKFYGRGYVHLTWRTNYRRAGEKIGVDLELFPDAAAEPANAARIMIEGMQAGWFTGKAMRHYLSGATPDYVGARRIINGTDKAAMIAGYARTFEQALSAAGYRATPSKANVPMPPPKPSAPMPAPIPPPPDITKPKEQANALRGGFWSRFWQSLTNRMKG